MTRQTGALIGLSAVASFLRVAPFAWLERTIDEARIVARARRMAGLSSRRARVVAAVKSFREANDAFVPGNLQLQLAEERSRLEKSAHMTVEEARKQLMKNIERDTRRDCADMIKQLEDEAKEAADAASLAKSMIVGWPALACSPQPQ